MAISLVGAGTLAAQTEEVEEPEALGSASTLFIETDPTEPVIIEAGTRLLERPHPHAPVVTVVDVELPLVPSERRGDWVRIHFGQRSGWAFLGEPPTPDPERSPAPAPPPPLLPVEEKLAPDADRLKRAIGKFPRPPVPVQAGSFQIYTDVVGDRKRQLAIDATQHLAEGYGLRYGLSPSRPATFAVFIYNDERAYREFERTIGELAQFEAEGHAGSGVAALVAADRTPEEIAALLVHELTHLLNRQMFIASLPPWLEEGLANDLAYCQLDRKGRLRLGTLGGKSFIAEVPGPSDRFGQRRFSGTFHMEGPIASLSLLKRMRAEDSLIPLPELLDLTWREFVDPEGRKLRYVQSTFLVRYLLDELGGDGFRRFLAGYQAGGSADATALLAALELDWDEITRGFRAWVRDHTGR